MENSTFENYPIKTDQEKGEGMDKNKFQETKDLIVFKEGEAWEEVQELRKKFEESHEEIFADLKIESIEQAVKKSFEIIQKTLRSIEGSIDFSEVDAGHGIGHLTRDYLHAVVLSKSEEIDSKQAYIGIIGGVLHDILGCTLVKRYAESERAVKHAEASALLFREISKEIDMDQNESLLVQYAIAAHTNYLKSSTVKCSDGIEREIVPYQDTYADGKPIMSVILTRWADRFDANGPCFVGRHFLTMIEDHKDFGAGEYYSIEFLDHMRPLLRDEETIKNDPQGRTMREHLMMYMKSQTNDSPYGRFDHGKMVDIREAYRERVFRIIESFDSPISLSADEEKELIVEWGKWLSEKIEPSEATEKGLVVLRNRFSTLPQETKEAWFSAMKTTLKEYEEWAQEMREAISELSEEELELPVIGDVRKII